MKKVLFSVTGIAVIVLLLAALGGAALASPAGSIPSDIPEAPVSVDEAIKEAAPAIVSTVRDEVAVKAIELSVVKGLIGRKQGGVRSSQTTMILRASTPREAAVGILTAKSWCSKSPRQPNSWG